MPWLKITFAANRESLDRLTGHLESAGAQAVTIEDAEDHPLFDHVNGQQPVWDNNLVSGLFDSSPGRAAVLEKLASTFQSGKPPDYQVDEIADTDWERSWLERYQPIHYGHGLWVCPTWHEAVDETATTLFLDPGLAFGSGTHETTAMCLRWLAANPPFGQHVIDVGCGSGILAIASIKLGAAHAIGIDIDPQALQSSKKNADLNQAGHALELYSPANQPKPLKGDLIFANILANTLLSLKDQLLDIRNEGGVLILSGILDEQADNVREAFASGNDILLTRDGDWIMMTVKASVS
jgi:ribosomal protein L11 methyltransferase